MAPPRGPQAHRAGEADGVPRDHPRRHRAGRRRVAATSTRPGRRPGEPSHRRPALRLPGVRGVLAQDPPGPVGRSGAVARACASWSSGSASAWRSSPPATGTCPRCSPPTPPSPPRSCRSTTSASPAAATSTPPAPRSARTSRCSPRARARDLRVRLEGQPFAVATVETKPYTSKPKPPFITSTLQQVGGSRLRMSSRQVMSVAQRLYEEGYITYMRTDSTTLSETALAEARKVIEATYGTDYLPDAPRSYAKKSKNAQEAHEAIRPVGRHLAQPRAAPRRAVRRPPPPVRADLAAHARVADARRPRQHGHRPHRRHGDRLRGLASEGSRPGRSPPSGRRRAARSRSRAGRPSTATAATTTPTRRTTRPRPSSPRSPRARPSRRPRSRPPATPPSRPPATPRPPW